MSTIANQASVTSETTAEKTPKVPTQPGKLSKQIVICCDGTWDTAPKQETTTLKSNVEILFESLPAHTLPASGASRLVKYFVAGKSVPKTPFSRRFLGGPSRLELDASILDAYRFIILNYTLGDEIYLFGFSKGAYIARSIAGLIRNCGILRPEHILKAEEAYKDYRDRHREMAPDSNLMKVFRKVYACEDISPIQFIGVWETVGQFGIPLRYLKNMERYRFHDNKLSSHVKNAFQALAIDEKRNSYKPAIWEVSQSSPSHHQTVEQRWFSGTHRNIGGGAQDKGLSDIALNWLLNKALESGLKIDLKDRTAPRLDSHPDFRAAVAKQKTNLTSSRSVHMQERVVKKRLVRTNESIDDSVRLRYACEDLAYKPKNIAPFMKHLETAKEPGLKESILLMGKRPNLSV